MSLNLKLASLDDLPEYLRLCQLFYEESPFAGVVEYSPDKTADVLHLAVETQYRQAVPLLLLDGTQPVGMLLGCATEVPFSDDRVAAELAWYVDPPYRGNRKALELVYAFEEWARRVGCKHASMSLLTTLTDVSKFYERLGYQKTEISYFRSLN